MGVGSWWCPTRTVLSTTSSPPPSIPSAPSSSSTSTRRWCDRLSPRSPRNPRESSKKPESLKSEAARAGVAHLVERNLPKVEVAGSRPVARSNSACMSHRGSIPVTFRLQLFWHPQLLLEPEGVLLREDSPSQQLQRPFLRIQNRCQRLLALFRRKLAVAAGRLVVAGVPHEGFDDCVQLFGAQPGGEVGQEP